MAAIFFPPGERGVASEGGIASADIRAQLERILSSGDFDATARERKFLSYVVAEELEGRGSRIKAYSIAVEVFGRDASFDPQNDPIVRIEAGHLRRSLERYYLTGGHSDSILIDIPKGAYVPTFTRRRLGRDDDADPQQVSVTKKSPKRRGGYLLFAAILMSFVTAIAAAAIRFGSSSGHSLVPETPRLLVEKFEDLSVASAGATLATGMTQEVITQLSRFRDIVVIEGGGATPSGGTQQPRYVLSGSVDATSEQFRLRVRLISLSDRSVIWASSYDGAMDVKKIVQAQADIAQVWPPVWRKAMASFLARIPV